MFSLVLHRGCKLGITMSIRKRSTCGIIVIGDEILNGSVKDTNSHFLCKHLDSFGVSVSKVLVIPDDLRIVAEEVSSFSKKYDYVITSGGIGPTHDDVTFEGVALAFGDEIYPHPEIVDFCREWFKTEDLSSPAMKLAKVPKLSKLNYGVDVVSGKRIRFPIVSVRNVYIFPGVPYLLEKAFNVLGESLFRTEMARYRKEVYINLDEVSIANNLNKVVNKYNDVKFGSYPQFYNSYYKTRITAESDKPVDDALDEFSQHLPKDCLVRYDPEPMKNMMEKMNILMESSDMKHSIGKSLQILQQCYQRYSCDEVVVCFNGGKDCAAVLHLTAAVLQHLHPETKLRAVYVIESSPFPQVTQFIQDTMVRYNMTLEQIPGPMKPALTKLLEDNTKIKAAVMGTRLGDPHTGKQTAFSPTDPDWPKLMRINPLLEWTYSQVWTFIRSLYLPYCTLYDRGYTSLGSTHNTFPNSLLWMEDKGEYKPAYTLHDEAAERNGRL